MKNVLYIIIILFLSFTIISCSSSSDDGASTTSDNTTTTTDDDTTTDTTAPVIAEVTAVTTPTNDTTPDYTFSSSEAGTITYGGSCSSITTIAISGNNTITLVSLSDGTYSSCTIKVTDSAGNISNTLTITSFIVDSTVADTTPPTVSTSSPSDGDTSVSITSTVSVTFSETMDTSSVTTNTLDTSCFGTFQVSSDGFTTCVQMYSSPSSSNSDKTFTVTPKNNLSYSTVFRIRITTGTKDGSGNSLTSQWNTSSGFQTGNETTPPTLTEVTAVTTPTNDNTSSYTFSSTEAGTISYGGSCISSTTAATTDNNTITFNALSDGTYNNCKIAVTDNASNTSDNLSVSSFIIDTTAPTIAETTLVPSLTNDNSTQYTFSSSEVGTISVGGSCSNSSDNNSALDDNMTVSFAALADHTYSDCTITVTDNASNSVTIYVNSFTIDTTAPTLAQVTVVTTPTNDNTSSYTFSSTETGTINYSVCSGSPDNASADNNTIIFDALADGPHIDCKISVTDNAGNTSDNLSVSSFTIDTVKPVLAQVTAVTTPTNVTTPSYVFSSNEAGTNSYGGSCGSSTTSSATSGDNTVILTQPDNSTALSDASYSCTITVTDSAGNASTALSVNTFVVDATTPTVDNVSSSMADGAYKLNDNITVTVTFSESVIVDNSSGNPRIQLETGTYDHYANYVSGNATSILSFLYTVQSGDNSSDLDYTSTGSLSANSGTIRDNASNNATLTLPSPSASGSLSANKAIVIDALGPTVDNVSSSSSDGRYFEEDNITITVGFNETVYVDNSSGNPRIQLETGTNDRYANYVSGNSTSILSFLYTVQSGDNSSDLDYTSTGSLSANSGTIRDNSTNDATLTLPSPGSSNSLSASKAIAIGGWKQQSYIKAVNNDPGDSFGYTISYENDTLVVGAAGEDSNQTTITNGTTASSDNNLSGSGAVYVYRRSGTTWSQEAYIKAVNSDEGDSFGNSLSIDNDTLAVGALYEDSNQTTITNGTTASSNNDNTTSGAVYVYRRSGTTWAQEAYIKTANNDANDGFSNRVISLDGDTLVVAATAEDSNQTTITNGTTASSDNNLSASGAVYVYRRSGTTWAQEAYIKAVNSDVDDYFGWWISLDGDTLAVGSYNESSNQTTITNGTTASSNNSNTWSGAVYVYRRSGTTWAQEAYIKPANYSYRNHFGERLSLDADTLVVGSAYEGSNQTTITTSAPSNQNTQKSKSGAVYVYRRTGTTWALESYIKAVNSDLDDWFGYNVSIDNDTLAVGAIMEDSNQTTITNGTTASSDNDVSNSGAVYVYKRTGTTWAQEAYIKASNSKNSLQFGSVIIADNLLFVGVSKDDSNQTSISNDNTSSSNTDSSGSGAVFVYMR